MELPIKTHIKSHYKLETINISCKLSPRYNDFGWLPSFKDSQHSKFLLRNVTCDASPRTLTAIAGPTGAGKTTLLEIPSGMIVPARVSGHVLVNKSGAGKTTLLEILSGMIVPARVSGHVLVNNLPMNVAHFRRVSGYVTQDDALFPLLTVEETLTYSARLRLKAGRKKAAARVQKLLKELGLEHIKGARVGYESSRGISTMLQKKRNRKQHMARGARMEIQVGNVPYFHAIKGGTTRVEEGRFF